MNLMNLAVTQDARPLHLKNPQTGVKLMHDKKPVMIYLYGMDHPAVEAVKRKNVNAAMKAGEERSVETVIDGSNAVMAAAMVKFENLHLDDSGKELVCTPETAMALLENPALPWIREQIDAFVGNRSNFMATLAKS